MEQTIAYHLSPTADFELLLLGATGIILRAQK